MITYFYATVFFNQGKIENIVRLLTLFKFPLNQFLELSQFSVRRIIFCLSIAVNVIKIEIHPINDSVRLISYSIVARARKTTLE